MTPHWSCCIVTRLHPDRSVMNVRASSRAETVRTASIVLSLIGKIMQSIIDVQSAENLSEVNFSLPETVQAPALARRIVESVLTDWMIGGECVECARLLVSELVTNAVTHGDGLVGLSLSREGRSKGPLVLHIEVTDGSSARARGRQAAGSDEHGRGLALVDMLANRWGQDVHPGGKKVWCDVNLSCDCVVPFTADTSGAADDDQGTGIMAAA